MLEIVHAGTDPGIFNNSLYDAVTPRSVPYWIRVMVANQLAASSPDWHSYFYRENSGTYNNQWQTLACVVNPSWGVPQGSPASRFPPCPSTFHSSTEPHLQSDP